MKIVATISFDYEKDPLSNSISEIIEAVCLKLVAASSFLKNPKSFRCSQDIFEIMYSSPLFHPSEIPIVINGTIGYQGRLGNANLSWEVFTDEYQTNDVIYVLDGDGEDAAKIEITNVIP